MGHPAHLNGCDSGVESLPERNSKADPSTISAALAGPMRTKTVRSGRDDRRLVASAAVNFKGRKRLLQPSQKRIETAIPLL